MNSPWHLLKSIAILLALVVSIGFVLRHDNVSAQSGYPPPGTPDSPSGNPGPNKIFLPLLMKNFQSPPPYTTSYYVGSPSQLQTIATQLGQYDANTPGKQDHLVVLAFGSPGIGTPPGESSQYGAYMTRGKGFVSLIQMASQTQQFALAWFSNLGSDTDSQLFIVIGVSASGSGVTTGHAGAFAGAIGFAQTFPFAGCCGGRAKIIGGIDIETLPSPWAPASTAKAWVDTYISSSSCTSGTAENGCLYDFGNAICPYPGFANCNSGWSRDDVWYVSYGARRTTDTNPFVLPIPQLYNTNRANALQWQNLSLFAATCTGSCQPVTLNRKARIFFPGIMTEVQACAQVATLGESCTGIDNPSWKSHTELFTALNSDPNTAQPSIRWTTDIKYQVFP